MSNKIIKRVIFFIEAPFNLRDYQRFGIELIEENGFYVEVWDFSPIFRPELVRKYIPPDTFYYKGLTVFNDEIEVRKRLSDLSDSDFIVSLISYDFKRLGIYRALSKSFADYLVFYSGGLPPANILKETWLEHLIEKVRCLTSLRHISVWKHLFMKLPLRCLGVKPARFLLGGGNRCFTYHFPVSKKTEVMQIHALDYDLYLKERKDPVVEEPIAVFLDEFFPFHPDYIILKRDSPVSADRYYSLLNDFFDFIEEKTGLEVVIAAHPRSHYEKLPDYFNGRKCVRGRTINLVSKCRLVLSHSSTSLNFANLFYKPVIFITCSDLHKTYEEALIREMATWFGKKPVFIDKDYDIDLKSELTVSKRHYDNYRRAYIKVEDSKDMFFWQVVSERLKQGF
jgi:hypothetical protein